MILEELDGKLRMNAPVVLSNSERERSEMRMLGETV
jgi:hypothetical protein